MLRFCVLAALAAASAASSDGGGVLEPAQQATKLALARAREATVGDHDRFLGVLLTLVAEQGAGTASIGRFADQIGVLAETYDSFNATLEEGLAKLKRNKKVRTGVYRDLPFKV